MARYLVTGAAGFIARKVIEKLAADGHEVVGVDNLNDSYDPRLKEWRLRQIEKLPGFTFIRDDICRPGCFSDLLEKHSSFEGVIHLAARAGVRQVQVCREFSNRQTGRLSCKNAPTFSQNCGWVLQLL